ncbi:Niemann-Pick C1, partial [Brachionus plicatilis]
ESLFGDLEGLMGNFNENSTDDIVGRDGNVPKDTSEREIFSVCETWKVQSSEDLFVPLLSPSLMARNSESYVPLFIDEIEIDPKVEENCKGNKQCIFDASASGILDIGLKTADDVNEVETVRENKDLSPPIIIFRENSTEINWYDNSSEIEITFEMISETLDTTAFLVNCECSDYYEGTYCENIRNGCGNGNPCNIVSDFNQTCQPLEVEEQKSTNRSFKCEGPCPVGYVQDENGACIDDLECDRDPPVCKDNSTCIEKVGSFECLCEKGSFYRNETCRKIDYCRTSINNCDSICTSIEDGVECSCYSGFFYNSSTNTCEQNNTITDCECEQLCGIDSNGTIQCFCRNGFESLNSTHCTDIKECQIDNGGCPETCIEKEGSFECSCRIGRKFNEEIKSCEECEPEFYGVNCNQTCNCSLNSIRCDPILGCVCNTGFEGLFCEIEIDGCEGINTNDILTCVSSYGTPKLSCESGFRLNNFVCNAIDLCIEEIPCNFEANCISLNGTFICECQSGFRYNYDRGECEDIQECLEREICGENSDCIELAGSYECACKNGYESTSSDSQNPNCVRRDLETNQNTSTAEDVSSTNLQASFSTSSSLFSNSTVATSSQSSFSSSNLLLSSTISSTISSSSSNSTVPNNSSLSSTSTFPNNSSLSSTLTIPNNSSLSSNIPNNSSLSSTLTIPNNSSSSSNIPNNSSLSSTITIPNNSSSSSTITIPNNSSSSSTITIATLSISSTLKPTSPKSTTLDFPQLNNLTTKDIINSTLSSELTTSSKNLNSVESSISTLAPTLLTKFRIILEKIIKLTSSQKRLLIVNDTNLTNLETELIKTIPNSIFKGYQESNDIFIDANITTELNDKNEIGSFIQNVSGKLNENEDSFNKVVPSEFTLSIEENFGVKVYQINADGTEQEIDITTEETNLNSSIATNNPETISTTTLSSSENSANYIPYKTGLFLMLKLYIIHFFIIKQ